MLSDRICQRLLEFGNVTLEDILSKRQSTLDKKESVDTLHFCNEKGEISIDNVICRIKRVNYYYAINREVPQSSSVSFSYDDYSKKRFSERIIETTERSFQPINERIIPIENQTLFKLDRVFIKKPFSKKFTSVFGHPKNVLIFDSDFKGYFTNSLLGFFRKMFLGGKIRYVEFVNKDKTSIILEFQEFHKLSRPSYILETEKIIGYESL